MRISYTVLLWACTVVTIAALSRNNGKIALLRDCGTYIVSAKILGPNYKKIL